MSTEENIRHELETAAQILLAPPNVVSGEQRSAAEAVFLQFRKTKSPFHLTRTILDSSQVDYVLFEAACLIKEGIIREWQQLSRDDIQALRSYLLQYVISHPNLSAFVRERVVQVMAIIIKRQSVEDQGKDREVILGELQQLIANGNIQMRMVGCSILAAILQEHATTVKSSDMGLTWEVHLKLKKQFEASDLQAIFKFCVQALRDLCDNLTPANLPTDVGNLILRLVMISETILSWTFISITMSEKLISIFEADQNPSFRPGASWKELLIHPSLVQLFFSIHKKVRHNPEIAHHTLICLCQLSSLNGAVMINRDTRLQYLTNYIKEFLGLVQHLKQEGNLQPPEALAISNIVRRLMLFFPPSVLTNVQADLLQGYLEQITELTCHFLKGTTMKASLEDEASYFSEACEYMLEGWVSILHESQGFPTSFCQQSAIEIFNTYLQCHLCAPDGIRGMNDDEDDEEIGETEEPDRQKFKDTLATIGALAREAPDHSFQTLCQLFDSRLSRLHGQIQRLISQGSREIDKPLGDLYEDLHWLLLVAGNVVSLDTDGEGAMIPQHIVRYSMERSANVNVEATLRVLASPSQPVCEVPGHESSDLVIRLIANVFRLAEVEKRAVEAGFASLLSPEVSSSICWFLRRWAVTYLAVNESYYSEISIVLLTAFGRDTDGAAWSINFIMDKVVNNLTYMSSEPALVDDTVNLLISLVDGKEKGRQALKCDGLMAIINLATSNAVVRLPANATRGLLKALVLVGSACEDQASRDQYWERVLKPICHKFDSLVQRPDLKNIYNDEKVRSTVISLLESFIGIAQGSDLPTTQQLYSFMKPILAQIVHLLSLYHNYATIVELVIEVFREVAKRMLCYLNNEDSRNLYQRCVECIQAYAHHNRGRRITKEKDAEEEQFRDLLLLMELLTNLLSKDFLDLAPEEDKSQQTISAADVCLEGINIIMPLMTLELLKFPSLCLQYFRTITLVAEIEPEKICNLNPEMQKNLILSLKLGLESPGMDNIYTLCCDVIQILCHYMVRKNDNPPIFEAFRPFLELIMNLILSQNVNSDLLPHASSTLYVLICCFKNTYDELVSYLINSQTDPNHKQRLTESFASLMANINLSADRSNRMRFRANFDKFIVAVRGFLLVK